MELNPTMNKYDIRIDRAAGDSWYDLTLITAYLNLPDVKKQLKVKDDLTWTSNNYRVNADLHWEVATDTSRAYAGYLQSNLSILIYDGDKDLSCNYIGCEAWMSKLEWPLKERWNNLSFSDLYVDNDAVGLVKHLANLKYTRIYGAGHQVPLDQPKVILDVLRDYISSVIGYNGAKDIVF